MIGRKELYNQGFMNLTLRCSIQMMDEKLFIMNELVCIITDKIDIQYLIAKKTTK